MRSAAHALPGVSPGDLAFVTATTVIGTLVAVFVLLWLIKRDR